jgi:hypothetical protein
MEGINYRRGGYQGTESSTLLLSMQLKFKEAYAIWVLCFAIEFYEEQVTEQQ